MAGAIGTVAGVWRYPVKSMQGEALAACPAGERGLAGDRGWAIVDVESQKIASAKHPKLWLSLLECAAMYVEELARDPQGDTVALPASRLVP